MKLQNKKLFNNLAFINNEWVASESGKVFSVINPFDGSKITDLPELNQIETKTAIDAASAAFESWKDVPQGEKAQILNRWADLISENSNDLAIILTTEQGKPISESRDEVAWSIGHIRYCANDSLPIFGKTLQQSAADKQTITIRRPFGVIASITPWNFPILTAIEKTVFPISAGNCVVLKPSDETPLSTLSLAYLTKQAGFPPGVLNIVIAKNASPIGTELANNPKVNMISFTGSTKIGKLLYKQAASTVKKVNLELGGNSPLIVFPDADIDAAARDSAGLKFLNSGQVCVNINRFFVHEAVYNEFIDKFIIYTKKLIIGSGLDSKTNFGPLLNRAGVEKVENLVSNAVDQGAKIVLGGNKRSDIGELFYEPTVLTNMKFDMNRCIKASNATHKDLYY